MPVLQVEAQHSTPQCYSAPPLLLPSCPSPSFLQIYYNLQNSQCCFILYTKNWNLAVDFCALKIFWYYLRQECDFGQGNMQVARHFKRPNTTRASSSILELLKHQHLLPFLQHSHRCHLCAVTDTSLGLTATHTKQLISQLLLPKLSVGSSRLMSCVSAPQDIRDITDTAFHKRLQPVSANSPASFETYPQATLNCSLPYTFVHAVLSA